MQLQNIDWEKYIERRNSIFYVSLFNHVYGKLLKNTIGFGFKHQLYAYKDGVYTFYKSGKELRMADEHFISLVKEGNTKLKEWHNLGLLYLKEEENLVNLFSKGVDFNYLSKNYRNIISLLHNIFLYLTTIPMMILSAIDYELKRVGDVSEFEEIIGMFEPFRKKSRNLLQSNVLEKMWKAASEKTGMPVQDFSFYTVEEFKKVFEGKYLVDKQEIDKRKKGCIFYEGDSGKLVFNYELLFFWKIGIKEDNFQELNELKGSISYKGFAKGIAKIINKPSNMDKFNEGDIIVSVNTTPSIMPVLVKSKAIVTDEGGLTCHASILSRELKIPCIVGTKLATKIFKDGDLIEVDAEKGIVRKV